MNLKSVTTEAADVLREEMIRAAAEERAVEIVIDGATR